MTACASRGIARARTSVASARTGSGLTLSDRVNRERALAVALSDGDGGLDREALFGRPVHVLVLLGRGRVGVLVLLGKDLLLLGVQVRDREDEPDPARVQPK